MQTQLDEACGERQEARVAAARAAEADIETSFPNVARMVFEHPTPNHEGRKSGPNRG